MEDLYPLSEAIMINIGWGHSKKKKNSKLKSLLAFGIVCKETVKTDFKLLKRKLSNQKRREEGQNGPSIHLFRVSVTKLKFSIWRLAPFSNLINYHHWLVTPKKQNSMNFIFLLKGKRSLLKKKKVNVICYLLLFF